MAGICFVLIASAAIAPTSDLTYVGTWTTSMNYPARLASAPGGGVYVTDPPANQVVHFDSSGAVLHTYPVPEGPVGIAVHGDGRVFLSRNDGKIGVYTAAFVFQSLVSAAPRALTGPNDLAFRPGMNELYAVDAGGHQVLVFTESVPGSWTLARAWGMEGPGLGQFESPQAIALDTTLNHVIVTDVDSFRVQVFDTTGIMQFKFGYRILYTADSETAWFARSEGVAVDACSNIYVADALMGTVRAFDSLGKELDPDELPLIEYGTVPGQLREPCDVMINTGRLYVADTNNAAVEVYGIACTGPTAAVAGIGPSAPRERAGRNTKEQWIRVVDRSDGSYPVRAGVPRMPDNPAEIVAVMNAGEFREDLDMNRDRVIDQSDLELAVARFGAGTVEDFLNDVPQQVASHDPIVPPHILDIANRCGRCHSMDGAPGGMLTALGQENLCQSCHSAGKIAGSASIGAGSLENSHPWNEDADEGVSDGPPPGSDLLLHLDNGKIRCGTCHDPHENRPKGACVTGVCEAGPFDGSVCKNNSECAPKVKFLRKEIYHGEDHLASQGGTPAVYALRRMTVMDPSQLCAQCHTDIAAEWRIVGHADREAEPWSHYDWSMGNNWLCTGPGTPYAYCTGDGVGTATSAPTAACTSAGAPSACCTGAGVGICVTPVSACTGVGTPWACCTGLGAGPTCFTNAECTGAGMPWPCCTGVGAGSCSNPSAACTGPGAPLACCTAAGKGTCFTNAGCTAAGLPWACCTASGKGGCSNSLAVAVCTGVATPWACCTGAGTGPTCVLSDWCTGSGTPWPCCTGAGTGNCIAVTSCTGVGTPSPCCTGVGTGTCSNSLPAAECTGAGTPEPCCSGPGAGSCSSREVCRQCHSGNGYIDWSKDFPDGAIASPTWRGSLRVIDCLVCHATHGQSADGKLLRIYDTVRLPTGQVYSGVGAGATCMSCHNGRSIPATNPSSVSTPHYLNGAAMLEGINAVTAFPGFGPNALCTGAAAPWTCCTAGGTGTCTSAVNAGCTAAGVPWLCCTGIGTGTCTSANCTGSGTPWTCCTTGGTGTCTAVQYTLSNSNHTTNAGLNCTTCHMAPGPTSGPEVGKVGGHTFRLVDHGAVPPYENVATCNASGCHSGLTTINRTASGDYDGDGTAEGVQDETRGILSLLKDALYTAGASRLLLNATTGLPTTESDPDAEPTNPYWTLSRCSGGSRNGLACSGTGSGTAPFDCPAGTCTVTVTGGSSRTATVINAIWNWEFVDNSGDEGIHNTGYAIGLLQIAYKGVTGVAVPGAAYRYSPAP